MNIVPFANINSIWNLSIGMILDGLVDDMSSCPWKLTRSDCSFKIGDTKFNGDKWECGGYKIWTIDKNEHSNETDNLNLDPAIWGPPIKRRDMVVVGGYEAVKKFSLHWMNNDYRILDDIVENKDIIHDE